MRTQTHMSDAEFIAFGTPDLVYIKPIKAEVLQKEGILKVKKFDPEDVLFAVHSADGKRLAVMSNHDSAVSQSIEHEMWPVSVH